MCFNTSFQLRLTTVYSILKCIKQTPFSEAQQPGQFFLKFMAKCNDNHELRWNRQRKILFSLYNSSSRWILHAHYLSYRPENILLRILTIIIYISDKVIAPSPLFFIKYI
jgi:hypothetical protein